jgi:hypothetical protein
MKRLVVLLVLQGFLAFADSNFLIQKIDDTLFISSLAEAVECKLVSISADRGSAIYDCGGRQITVLRGVVVR